MSFQEIGWKILHLVWQAKGYGNKELPPLLHKNCPNVEGLGESTIRGKVSRDEFAPPEVAQFVIERMAARKGKERRTEIVLLGVAALLGQPLPKDSKPAQAAHELRTAFPREEIASMLADALVKQSGLLDALRSKLESLLSSLASVITREFDALGSSLATLLTTLAGVRRTLDALASAIIGKLDALASSLVSLLTMLAGVRRTLDAVDGKLDHLLSTLGLVAATVNHVDAKGDLAEYARGRESRRVLRAVGLVGLLGLVGFAAVLVLLVGVLFAVRQHQSPPSSVNVNIGTGAAEEAAKRQGADVVWQRLVIEMGKPKGRPMPHQPLPGQDVAPCKGSAVTLYGACWLPTSYAVPCPPDLFEEGGKCYAAIHTVPANSPSAQAPSPSPNPEHR